MSWIPDWAAYYSFEHSNGSVEIYFYSDIYHSCLPLKPISELPKDLAINDVCQQIRERKTIDECSPSEWDHELLKDPVRYKAGKETVEIKSKYHREIKPGVFVDVYDILRAYGIKCHALAHAIKKLLMPGERGHKDYNQDCEEAIQSIRRSIDEHV